MHRRERRSGSSCRLSSGSPPSSQESNSKRPSSVTPPPKKGTVGTKRKSRAGNQPGGDGDVRGTPGLFRKVERNENPPQSASKMQMWSPTTTKPKSASGTRKKSAPQQEEEEEPTEDGGNSPELLVVGGSPVSAYPPPPPQVVRAATPEAAEDAGHHVGVGGPLLGQTEHVQPPVPLTRMNLTQHQSFLSPFPTRAMLQKSAAATNQLPQLAVPEGGLQGAIAAAGTPTVPLWLSENPLHWLTACSWYKPALVALEEKKPKLKILAANHRPKSDDQLPRTVAFTKLDADVRGFFFSSATIAKLSPEECHSRVCDIMLWKLSKGQFRPGLLQQCASNPPQTVKKILMNTCVKLNQEFLKYSVALAASAANHVPATNKVTPPAASNKTRAATPPPPSPGGHNGLGLSPAKVSGGHLTTSVEKLLATPGRDLAARGGAPNATKEAQSSPLRAALLHGSTTAHQQQASPIRQLMLQQEGAATAAVASTTIEDLKKAVIGRTQALGVAVKDLSQLKGIGPATATAILQQFQLDNHERGICPFFADEAAAMVLSGGRPNVKLSLKYSQSEIEKFISMILNKHLQLKMASIEKDYPLATVAEMGHAMWASVAKRQNDAPGPASAGKN